MTDKNKSRIHRRGDHWSPLFKLFKLFPSINHQPKLIANSALFGKESCQCSWLRDWIISARSPTPSWLTVKLYTNHKFVKANKKADDFLSSALFGSHSWTRTNDILINSQALYRLSYAGIFNFVLNHLYRLSFCRATLLPTPFPSPSFGYLRGNPSGAVPTELCGNICFFKI